MVLVGKPQGRRQRGIPRRMRGLKYQNTVYTDVPGGKVSILGGHSLSHSKQKMYMYTCTIPNDFRDRAISLHSSKIVGNKEILHAVSRGSVVG
jgi:hypothetical protein